MILLHCLDTERRAEVLREMARVAQGQPYRWPEVDRHTHPTKAQRVRTERRQGPRSSRFGELR